MIIYILNNYNNISKQINIISNKLYKNVKYLSKSHSGIYTVIAINKNGKIGIDIEKKVDRSNTTIKYFFSKYKSFEVNGCNDFNQHNFYKVWTAMESYYKLYKKGFYTDKKFCLDLENNLILVFGKEYYIKFIEYDNYIISVCTESKKDMQTIEIYYEIKI